MFELPAISYKNGGMNRQNSLQELPADTVVAADRDNARRRHILIAFATSEGQTARIAGALAHRLTELGHDTDIANLGQSTELPGPEQFDAIIVAASVHAGKHQDSASSFVASHKGEFATKPTAFLSVSISAAANTEQGRERAKEQVNTFLDSLGWRPDDVEMLAGAMHYSRFSRPWRWILKLSQAVFRKPLRQQGWPDLTIDREFTDWAALQQFADRFCARFSSLAS